MDTNYINGKLYVLYEDYKKIEDELSKVTSVLNNKLELIKQSNNYKDLLKLEFISKEEHKQILENIKKELISEAEYGEDNIIEIFTKYGVDLI